jgi:hypothetical protein
VSFRERRFLNAANLGHDQDPNASDNCAIHQVVRHVGIGHGAELTPGSADRPLQTNHAVIISYCLTVRR